MLGMQQEKVFIVHDSSRKNVANGLRQLVSIVADQDAFGISKRRVACSVMDAKRFDQQMISSEQKVIFIGGNSMRSKYASQISPDYDEYGVSYGTLGRQAFIHVSRLPYPTEMSDFKADCKEYDDKVKAIAERGNASQGVLVGPLLLLIGIGIGVGVGIKAASETTEKQYYYGMHRFVVKELSSFVGAGEKK